MVGSRLALADTLILQTGQGRQHVDGRLHALPVQFTAQDNLALGDVTGQVRNRMGLVVLRHGQDRDQRNTSLFALLPSRTLIHGRQVGVQISRITTPSRNLLTGRGNFTERVRIVCDIRQNHQHVHILLEGQIFRSSQRHTRRGDTLYRRVICKVDEKDGTVNGARLFEAFRKEIGFLKGDSHGCEYNRKGFAGSAHLRLTGNLRAKLGMRQTGSRENRQLLTPDQGIQTINGGHARLDELIGVISGCRIHRQTVDVPALVRQDLRSLVNGTAQAVEDAAQHIGRHAQLHGSSQETHLAVGQVNSRGVFIKLH